MALSRSTKHRQSASPLSKLLGLFSSKTHSAANERKTRRLCVDALEERQMLSVTVGDPHAVTVNQVLDDTVTTHTTKVYGDSADSVVAVDNDGDMVMVWTRTDDVINPFTGAISVHPLTGVPRQDTNVYARYLTDEVQRVTLPDGLVADATPNSEGHFSLTYGENEVQKLEFFQALRPVTDGYFGPDWIIGQFNLEFVDGGSNVLDNFTGYFNEALGTEASAQLLQDALRAVGDVFEDVVVAGVSPTEFEIRFGDAADGQDIPQIQVVNPVFTQGFLPGVLTSTVSEPMTITYFDANGNAGIPVYPDDPERTAEFIKVAFANEYFANNGVEYVYGPVDTDLPVSEPIVVRKYTPQVQVVAVSATEFDITFVGTSGKQDHPELKIASALDEYSNQLTISEDAVATLKESSPEFRVNPDEYDDPDTPLLDIADQYNPVVAMDVDGDFVIAWETEVQDYQDPGNTYDIYARRFSPQAIIPDSAVNFFSTNAGETIPVQGVRPLGTAFRVNTTTADDQRQPSIGMDDQGNFAIAWCNQGQDLSNFSHVYLQQYNRDAERIGNEIQLSTERTGINFDPNVVMSDDGYLWVGWEYTHSPGYITGTGVIAVASYFTLLAPDGTLLETENGMLGVGSNQTAGFDSENNLIVVGHDLADADPAFTSTGVFATMYAINYDEATGVYGGMTQMRAPFAVHSSNLSPTGQLLWPGPQFDASVGIDADGDLFFAYEGYGADTSTDLVYIPGYVFSDQINNNKNSDLLNYFNPSWDYLSGADVDGAIEGALIDAMALGATDGQLGQLNAIFESYMRNLRNNTWSTMTTRIDTSQTATTVLATDSILDDSREGNNQKYFIMLDPSVNGGNFLLRLYHPWAGGSEVVTVPIATFGNGNNQVIDRVGTGENLEAVLEAAARTGGGWAARNYLTDEEELPISVRIITGGEIANRVGTPWEVPTRTPNDIVYEVTFQGSVHDLGMGLGFPNNYNNLTTQGTNEVQQYFIQSDEAGYFQMTVRIPQPNNAPDLVVVLGPYLFEPGMDPNDLAASIAGGVGGVIGGVTVTPGTSDGERYEFYISFNDGVDHRLITFNEVAVPPDAPLVGLGFGYLGGVNGGSDDAPPPRYAELYTATSGTVNSGSWVAVEPDGDYVVVWEETTVGNYDSQRNIVYRRFEEDEDQAGPQVTDFLLPSGERLAEGGQVDDSLEYMVVSFDEEMDHTGANSILNPNNWVLMKDGVPIIGGVTEVVFGMNAASTMDDPAFTGVGSNKWEAVVKFDANGYTPGTTALTEGRYQIVVKDTLGDMYGNALLRSGYQANGGVYSREFDVVVSGGAEQTVNDVLPGGQETRPMNDLSEPPAPRAVANDGDGDYVSVWTEVPDGSGRQGVYAKLYDLDWSESNGDRIPEGAVPIKLIQVSTNPTANYASVAMDGDGDFVVVWSQLSDDVNESYDIWARRYDSAGNALGGAFLVNGETGNMQHYASVAMDIDGDFFVAWQSLEQDGSGWGVYGQRFGPDGEALGGADEVQSIRFEGASTGRFQLEFDGQTTAPIVFGQNRFAIPSLIEQALAGIGVQVEVTAISGEELFIRFTGDHSSRDVAQLVLRNLEFNPGSDAGAYVSINTRVEGADGEILINSTVLNNQYHPSVGASDSGQFVVTWTGAGQDGDAPYETNIYARTFVPNDDIRGTAVDPSNTLEITSSAKINAVVTTDDPSNHIVGPGIGYDGVCKVEVTSIMGSGYGSGSLLSSGRHVLTAAHVVTDAILANPLSPDEITVTFETSAGLETFGVTQIFVNPNYTPIVAGPGDIAILVLDRVAPDTIERYELYRDSNEVGEIVEIVGYGTNGQGNQGNVFPGGIKRLGHNTVDAIAGDYATSALLAGVDPELLVIDFDTGSPLNDALGQMIGVTHTGLTGDVESNLAPGDSGGPMFINGQVAGVNSWGVGFAGLPDVLPGTDFSFGEVAAAVRVSGYVDWIDSITQGGGGLETLVNTFTAGDQKWSSVAVDSDGDFVVTWTSFGQDGVGNGPGAGVNGLNGVYARRFNSDGTAAVFDVNGNLMPPATAAPGATANGVVSVELQNGTEFLVNTYAADDQQLSQVSMDSNGDFAVVWESFQDRSRDGGTWTPDTANSYGIYAQRFASSDTISTSLYLGLDGQIGGELDVNLTKTGDQRSPSIAVNDNGDMAVLWAGAGQIDMSGVFLRRFDRSIDDAPPMVTDVINAVETVDGYVLEQVLNGTTVSNEPTKFVLAFSENLMTTGGSSVANPANWQLISAAGGVTSKIVAVEFGLSQAYANLDGGSHDPITGLPTLKYEAVVTFDGDITQGGLQPLPAGEYTLIVRDSVEDLFGNALDGDGDGVAEGQFSRVFFVGEQTEGGDQPGDPDPGDEDDPAFSTPFYDQVDPAMAVSSDGSYVVVATSYGTALDAPFDDFANGIEAEGNIIARRYDRYGRPLSSEFIVNTGWSEGHQHSPDVAADGYGNFVVTWEGEGQFETDGIFCRVFDMFGVPLTEEIQVNTRYTGIQMAPSVGMDAAGNFTIAWESQVPSKGWEVVARRFDIHGNPLSGEFTVNSHASGNQRNADVAVADNGSAVVVWQSDNQDYSSTGVFGQRYSASGARVGGEFGVNQQGDGAQDEPSVAMDAVGNFVVAWTSDEQDGDEGGVFARRFTSSGVGSNEFRVNQYTVDTQHQPDVSMAENGQFVVTWSTFDQEGVNWDPILKRSVNDFGVFARMFNANGSAKSSEFRVNETTLEDQFSPATAMDADGDFMVAWVGPDEYFNGYLLDPTDPTSILFAGTYDVFLRAYAVNTGPVSSVSANPTASFGLASYADTYAGGGYIGLGSSATQSRTSSVTYRGTEGADVIEIAANASGAVVVKINGAVVNSGATLQDVTIDGMGGEDTLVFNGSSAAEIAAYSAATNEASVSVGGHVVTVYGVEDAQFHGGAEDSVLLYDSAGDDVLVSKADSTTLVGDGYSVLVDGFGGINVVSSNGGADSASLYDSAGRDRVKFKGAAAEMARPGSLIAVNGFESIAAYSNNGGADVALTYGTSGNDKFKATPDVAFLFGADGVKHRMFGFDTVMALPFSDDDNDVDTASIIGSHGDDRFYGDAEAARMVFEGSGSVSLEGFRTVDVAGSAGMDRATLLGTIGNETFISDGALMDFSGQSFQYRLKQFDMVEVDAGGGLGDQAVIVDTPADDVLTSVDDTVKLSNGMVDVYTLIAFEHVTAKKQNDGDDEAYVAADLVFLQGDWNE